MSVSYTQADLEAAQADFEEAKVNTKRAIISLDVMAARNAVRIQGRKERKLERIEAQLTSQGVK